MADYVYIENYSKNGKMGISHLVFDQIASLATDRVKGASVAKIEDSKNKKSSRAFALHKPVICDIKNGIVNVKIDVTISAQANVNAVCLQIQEEVANTLQAMTELVPFNINIKVTGITE
ncbi:MAG: Asp23/Gls24 family envelope stress response protein [Bacilli bacterium]|nr:Asp23/Gls24 family envelope stress response protein [Bacilli bacterium]